MSNPPIIVIGAGIVGVCCASYLRREGREVVLLEREEGPGEGTSKGNAGALSPGSCVPLAMPGVFRKIPGWLTDPEGPLTIQPRYFLRALPWLMRFTASATPARVQQIADGLRLLHRHVYDCYEPLVNRAGCQALIHQSGTLNLYRSEAALKASMSDWKIRADRGGTMEVLTGAQMRELEPALSPAFTHGVLLPDHGYLANPYRLVRALAQQFVAEGGRIEQAAVRALRGTQAAGRVTVTLADGRELTAERVVVAAGAWSSALLAPLGIRIPLETQRGYQVTIADAGVQPRMPITVSEDKYYATPMEDGLRVAGTVEFAGLDAPPQYRRARKLLEQVRQVYPSIDTTRFTEWMGHRPCLPDTLPAIGSPRGHAGLVLAFGHGHNGMTSGPVTGRLVTDLVAARRPFIDPAPFLPDRF
jgi:D-amino-acid dehydrogenase